MHTLHDRLIGWLAVATPADQFRWAGKEVLLPPYLLCCWGCTMGLQLSQVLSGLSQPRLAHRNSCGHSCGLRPVCFPQLQRLVT